jgi:Na+/melibiose symporter-like transporter
MNSHGQSALLVCVIVAVFLLESLLWFRFRRDWRGKRILVAIARHVVVVAGVLAYGLFGSAHAVAILVITILAVVCISFIPVQNDRTTPLVPRR